MPGFLAFVVIVIFSLRVCLIFIHGYIARYVSVVSQISVGILLEMILIPHYWKIDFIVELLMPWRRDGNPTMIPVLFYPMDYDCQS